MKILEKIYSFCKDNNFNLENKSILVAASGGVDSMVLIDILLQNSFISKIGIAHCNFSLRGVESDEDENFLKEYATKEKIPLHSITFDTKKIATQKQKSIQLTARELRYDFFEKISKENNYDYIATAHHLSDSLETSIYHLSKGTGIAGIRGILPQRNSLENNETPIIRPLLCLIKEEILNYASHNKLKWREDASNQTQKYKRNFIRHQIIPLLKKVNPDAEKTFLNTSQRLRSMENLLQFYVKEFEKMILINEDKSNWIEVSEIKKLIEPLLIISEFLKKKGFSYKQSKQIIEQIADNHLKTKETKTFISKTHILYTSKSKWILSPQKSKQEQKGSSKTEFLIDWNNSEKYVFKNDEENINLSFEKCVLEEVDFKSEAMYLDFDKVGFPLTLRKWKSGDKFSPLGMPNRKSIGNFLTDLKIPIYEREFIYVLIAKNIIVWIGIIKQNGVKGLRIANKYKLDYKTKVALKIG